MSGAYRDHFEDDMERHESMRDREYLDEQRADREAERAPLPDVVAITPTRTADTYRRWWIDAEEKLAQRPASLVREFHERFGLVIRDVASAKPVGEGERALREALHAEELEELHGAMGERDVVQIADALADLIYVLYGTALHYGIDLDAVVREVHRSNMTKLGAGGEPLRRDDGKILKPDTFEPPRIAIVLGVDA